MEEHDLSHLSTCEMGSDNLIKYFGTGMESYFRFVGFLGVMNGLLGVVNLISLVIQWSSSSSSSNEASVADLLFVDYTGAAEMTVLIVTNVLLLTALVLWYRRHGGQIFAKVRILDGEAIIPNDDKISACLQIKRRIPNRALHLLRATTSLLFVSLFFAYYYSQRVLQDYLTRILSPVEAVDIFVGQTTLSLSFVFIDFVWRLSCSLLTSIESHKYQQTHQESDCVKSFLSRVIMFSIFIWVQHPPNTLERRAHQMMNLLLLNTTLAPFIDVWTVYCYQCLNRCLSRCSCYCCPCCCPCGVAEEDDANHLPVGRSDPATNRLKFNLADEYTQLLFRQYLINQCSLFVPLAPWIAGLGCVLVWWAGKYKLIKFCQVPEQRQDDRFSKIIFLFLLINMMATVVAYPNGYLWIKQEF